MRAGQLRHRVTIQQRTDADDGAGGLTITWTPLTVLWASVAPQTGRETIAARQVTPAMTHLVRLRYYAGLTTKHRVVLDGRALDILAIQNVEERNRELVLSCQELPQELPQEAP